MTFHDFLSHRKASHDAKGDFVRLALTDPVMPDFANWNEMRTYFVKRHDNEEIADAGEDVWKLYEAAQRKLNKAVKT